MPHEFEMTPGQHATLMDACKPTPAMFLSGGQPMCGTPQENANSAWQALARELGFVWNTARPVPGKSARFFYAEPVNAEAAT